MNKEEILKNAKPILFNTEMVQAILDGRKTVTRRNPFKFEMKEGFNPDWSGYSLGEYYTGRIETGVCLYSRGAHDVWGVRSNVVKPKYKVGDILYVKEKFNDIETYSVLYAADKDFIDYGCKRVDGYLFMESEVKWKSSIHMPKEAARIFLKITDVRVERLRDINGQGHHDDFFKEGIYKIGDATYRELSERFENLWDNTIKKQDLDKYGWKANPWVWVIEFERVEIENEKKY